MNPTLGLLLPLTFGQGPVVPASACAPCAVKAPSFGSTVPCAPPRMNGPYLSHPAWAPPQVLCAPAGPPAPVLAMKTVLPEGVSVAFDASETRYGNGSTFGFRPGFAYRFRLDGVSKNADEAFGGSIEVRGSIVPRPGMKFMEYTAPLHVSAADLERLKAGAVVTKVIYLENPEKAVPEVQKADKPLELSADSERDAFEFSEASGRIAAIVRLGDRAPTKQELTEYHIPGTVLFPGESKLGKPAAGPMFGECAIPLYDPVLGPKASTEECFPNGGDGGLPAGIGIGNKVGGLDVTDVIAEYTKGTRREVTTSNVVCLCAPRFITRRVEMTPAKTTGTFAANATKQIVARSVFDHRQQAQQYLGRERTLGVESRQRPSAYVALTTLHALGTTQSTKVLAKFEGIQLAGSVVGTDEATNSPSRLILTKEIDPQGPFQSGDIVTITLKYRNSSRQPITDLVISDSLSPRLELVEGSPMADRVSNVTYSEAEGGQTTIRFDIPGPIPPGGTGTAVFKVKIR